MIIVSMKVHKSSNSEIKNNMISTTRKAQIDQNTVPTRVSNIKEIQLGVSEVVATRAMIITTKITRVNSNTKTKNFHLTTEEKSKKIEEHKTTGKMKVQKTKERLIS